MFRDPSENIKVSYGTATTLSVKQGLGAMFVPGGSKTKPSNNGGMIRVLDECRRCKGSVRVA
jgi:hypothetical protein